MSDIERLLQASAGRRQESQPQKTEQPSAPAPSSQRVSSALSTQSAPASAAAPAVSSAAAPSWEKRINVSLSGALHRKVRYLSVDTGMNMQQLADEAFTLLLEKHGLS